MKGTEKQIAWAKDIMAKISADTYTLEAIANGKQPLHTAGLKRGEKVPEGYMRGWDAVNLIQHVGTIAHPVEMSHAFGYDMDIVSESIAIVQRCDAFDADRIKAAAADMAKLARKILERVDAAAAWITLREY